MIDNDNTTDGPRRWEPGTLPTGGRMKPKVKTTQALHLVRTGREYQDWLKLEGRFRYTCADPEMGHFERLAVLGEEFGEVARAALEAARLTNDRRDDGDLDLRRELVQVAAVAVAWIEALL